MGQSSDQIRKGIDESRRDAANKIDELKEQVEGSAADMRGQVQDAAGAVMDQAKATVDDTIQTAKENFDLKQEIEERPLVALGAALIGGFLLGGMSSGGGRDDTHQHPSYSSGTPIGQESSGRSSGGLRGVIHQSGLEDMFSNAAAAVMGSVSDQVRDVLDRNIPGFNEKMSQAQQRSGSFSDKAKATTSTERSHM